MERDNVQQVSEWTADLRCLVLKILSSSYLCSFNSLSQFVCIVVPPSTNVTQPNSLNWKQSVGPTVIQHQREVTQRNFHLWNITIYLREYMLAVSFKVDIFFPSLFQWETWNKRWEQEALLTEPEPSVFWHKWTFKRIFIQQHLKVHILEPTGIEWWGYNVSITVTV